MKIKFFAPFFPLCIIVIFSCAGQKKTTFIPVPQNDYVETEKNNKGIDPDNIIETKNGASVRNLPGWLAAFINGGIEEIERMNAYYGKYIFIGSNEGVNFIAMNMWADNFSAVKDFTILAAERIERRMISGAYLYPDYEYGLFFETMVKKAYGTVYTGAVKEDTYWIKIKIEQENDNIETAYTEIYNFFVLISIDKMTMQAIISGLMTESLSAVTPTAEQRNSINRLQQNFFERF
jgi:hypothetical protein